MMNTKTKSNLRNKKRLSILLSVVLLLGVLGAQFAMADDEVQTAENQVAVEQTSEETPIDELATEEPLVDEPVIDEQITEEPTVELAEDVNGGGGFPSIYGGGPKHRNQCAGR
jgi:cytoskeletal protein RodZ